MILSPKTVRATPGIVYKRETPGFQEGCGFGLIQASEFQATAPYFHPELRRFFCSFEFFVKLCEPELALGLNATYTGIFPPE